MRSSGRILAIVLLASSGLAQVGCRACSCEHDYSPPLAGCNPEMLGGRRGSVMGGAPMMGMPIGEAGVSGVYTGGEHAMESASRVATKPADSKTL